MKPGELERQLTHLTQVAREAQTRLSGALREVGELRRTLDVGPAQPTPARSVATEVSAAAGAVGQAVVK